jgi:crossover junction endodeoxyribonuclease RusA
VTIRRSRAADTQRTWRIDMPCGPLLTSNQRLHHQAKARLTRQLRGEAKLLALAAKIPALERVHVYAYVIPPDRRKRDPANWYPSVKAAIDGLTDAGVIPDDDAAHLLGPDMRLGVAMPPCNHLPAPIAKVTGASFARPPRRVHLRLLIEELAAGYGDPPRDED